MNDLNNIILDADEIIPRLEGESSRAYRAFLAYCEMGASRSLRELVNSHRLDKSSTAFRWSRKNNWVERSRKYDDALLQVKVKAKLREAAKEAAKWQRRLEEGLEMGFQNAESLRLAGESMLKVPMVREVETPEGLTYEPEGSWRSRDIPFFLKTSLELKSIVLTAATKAFESLSRAEIRAIAGLDDEEPSEGPQVDDEELLVASQPSKTSALPLERANQAEPVDPLRNQKPQN
jgi:hypothetical protein